MKLSGGSKVVFNYLTDAEMTMRYYRGFSTARGKAAEELGLTDGVSEEQFDHMFYGRHPHTGEQLAKSGFKRVVHEDGTEEMVQTRTPMIDVVYGAPKSLAVLYVAATPELRAKLDEVMLAAAGAAHDAMEATAKLARIPAKRDGPRTTKQQGSATERVTAKLIALPVIQYTARHTEESLERGVPDPQIHVHSPIFTLCKVGDRWLTADEFGMKNRTNAKYRDAVFMGELARGLEALGVELEFSDFDRSKGGEVRWEIKDVDQALCRRWSSGNEKAWRLRREYEEKHGRPISEVKLGDLLYKTRMPKSVASKRQDSSPNFDLWREDARQAGFKLGVVDVRREVKHNESRDVDTLRKRLLSSNGLHLEDSVFDESSIQPTIAGVGVGLGFTQKQLYEHAKKALIDSGELVLVRKANNPDHRLWTTKTMLREEHYVREHRDSHRHVWVDITGKAGTGKSRLTGVALDTLSSLVPKEVVHEGRKVTLQPAPIAEAFKAALARQDVKLDDEQFAGVKAIVEAAKGADHFVVVSTSGTVAERTGRKVKADAWGSIDSVLSRIEQGSLKVGPRTLLIIEEAGMVDTLKAGRLLRATKGARVLTLGDSKQLSPIAAAGWYTDALKRHGSIELTNVRRQENPQDIRDLDLIRSGRGQEAMVNLHARGRLVFAADDGERMAAMAAKYREIRELGVDAQDVRMIFDGRNTDVDAANRAVDRFRIARGEVSRESITVERDDGRRWELHENDNVMMLETVRVPGEAPVKNGLTGVVRKLDHHYDRVKFEAEDGRTVSVPASAVGRADAVHNHRYQGGEVDHALIAPSTQTSLNSMYTLQSRGKKTTHTFASVESHKDIATLGEIVSRPDEKLSAHAVIEQLREKEVTPPSVRSEEVVSGERRRPAAVEPEIEIEPIEESIWPADPEWSADPEWPVERDGWEQSEISDGGIGL